MTTLEPRMVGLDKAHAMRCVEGIKRTARENGWHFSGKLYELIAAVILEAVLAERRRKDEPPVVTEFRSKLSQVCDSAVEADACEVVAAELRRLADELTATAAG